MAETDWVVVPSRWWENSPLVIQEAFMHGRPVICSGIGGMAEHVQDRVSGLHFEVGDDQSLADVIWKRPSVRIPGASSRAGCLASGRSRTMPVRSAGSTRRHSSADGSPAAVAQSLRERLVNGFAVVGHVEWVDFLAVGHVPVAGEIVHAEGWWAEAAGRVAPSRPCSLRSSPVARSSTRRSGTTTSPGARRRSSRIREWSWRRRCETCLSDVP